jgi:outer membrane protein assembly factor BamD (BamD/ComL family)
MLLTVGLVIAAWFSIDSAAGGGDAPGQIVGVLMGMVYGLCLAVIWAPLLMNRVSEVIGSLFTGGSEPPTPQPFYSVAEARIKQGKFGEAITEIQRQLESFPTDVTGNVLLAQVQAEHLHDLPAAQLTIQRFCQQPGHPPQHLAYALNALADWHLKLQDPDAARAAFEQLIRLAPNTEQAHVAAQRIAHLATRESLLAAHEHEPIPLRPGANHLGLMSSTAELAKPEEDPGELTERLLAQLEQHPLDNEARERLALLYAGHHQRLDLAIAQLEQLIATPYQSGKEVARWLNVIADLQILHGATYDEVQQTLQRVVDGFPGLAAAQLAQQRIEHLRLELKGKEKSPLIKLGSYEKDLGLKRPPPASRT